jgi:hypothetical protein
MLLNLLAFAVAAVLEIAGGLAFRQRLGNGRPLAIARTCVIIGLAGR